MSRFSMIMKAVSILIIVAACGGCRLFNGWVSEQEKLEREVLGHTPGTNPRVEEIQSLLKEKGFDPGDSDGKLNDKTRQAIRDFQQLRHLDVTGFVDYKTLSELNILQQLLAEKKGVPFSNQLTPVETIPANSTHNPSLNKKSEKVPAPKVSHVKNKKEQKFSQHILSVQKALKTAGFDPGSLDGKMGGKTKLALMHFQTAKGLKPDGVIGPQTWEKLEPFIEHK